MVNEFQISLPSELQFLLEGDMISYVCIVIETAGDSVTASAENL
jgi:hypothetical protein